MKNLMRKKFVVITFRFKKSIIRTLEKMILRVVKSTMDVQRNTKAKKEIIYTEKGGHTVQSINLRSYFIKYRVTV